MGNPLLKNYNIDKDPFLSGGFNNLWKIYKGSRKDRKQDVCIFVLDKKCLDKYSKDEKEEVLNILKKEAGALVKFKHPSVLSIYEQILEDKTSLVFVTEPVQYTLTSWIETSGASKLEIKLMIAEMCSVMSFLHVDAHVIHTTINPDNIFINPQGHVKLSGLSFCITDPPISGMELKLNPMYSDALPNLKYVAPEIVFDSKTNYCSDIFSIGMIIYNVLKFHKGDTDRDLLGLNSNTVDAYKKSFEIIENKLMRVAFESDDNDVIFKALNKSVENRPTIKELLDHQWFNDPKLKALRFVENLEQNELSKNIEFLTKFPNILQFFENKIIEKRFLPCFMNALKVEGLIVNTLPAIFSICESSSFKIEFEQLVWPGLKTLFQMKQIPAAALYFLLSKLNFIAEKISNSEFSSNMMNIICKALDCGVAKIQTVVLDNLLFIIKKVDSLAFKNQIYPRLVNIVLNTNSNSLKISILKSFSTVYSLLDQNIINESLLNTLEKIRKSDNSSDVCMSIIGIYEEIAKVVSVESIANKILPNLISILVSGNISRKNFENIMNIVQKYLTRIKDSREKDLVDDNSNKLENQDINFNSQSTSANYGKNEKEDFNFLDSFFGSGNVSKKSNSNTNNMEFDSINKNLGDSSKKSNLNIDNNFKKEKTIFDGIVKDNSNINSATTNSTIINYNNTSTSNHFNALGSKGSNTITNTQSNVLNLRNNSNLNLNQKTEFNNKNNNFANLDFTKNIANNSGTNPNTNILDSLLSELPSQGIGNNTSLNNMNKNNMNNKSNLHSLSNFTNTNSQMNMSNFNMDLNYNNNLNYNNSNLNSKTDDYNLDFLKGSNNRTNPTEINYDFNFDLSKGTNKKNSIMNNNQNINTNTNTNTIKNDPFFEFNLQNNNKNDQKNIFDGLLKF